MLNNHNTFSKIPVAYRYTLPVRHNKSFTPAGVKKSKVHSQTWLLGSPGFLPDILSYEGIFSAGFTKTEIQVVNPDLIDVLRLNI